MNILSIKDLTVDKLKKLVDRTIIFSKKKEHGKPLAGKRVALLFSESSLRTKISFELAAQMLGGAYVNVHLPHVMKEFDGTPRENLLDVLKSLERWVDVIVIRDYYGKYLDIAVRESSIPVIDAFCGKDHPSQTICDLALLKKVYGRLEGLKVCLSGPETGSGIMESFAYGAVMLGVNVMFLAPEKYAPKIPGFFENIARLQEEHNGSFGLTSDKRKGMEGADVLYADEWWDGTHSSLGRGVGDFKVDANFIREAPSSMKIMHCLPAHHDREISKAILHSERSLAFQQAEFRLYSAMAALEFAINGLK